MRKRTIVIASALMLGAGIYIGSRPDSLTASQRTELAMRAKNLIGRINRKDFDACTDSFDDTMLTVMTSDRMERVFGPALSALGDFHRFRKILVTGKDPSLSEYSICQVRCQYEKGPATYTILFNDKGLVCGIYLK